MASTLILGQRDHQYIKDLARVCTDKVLELHVLPTEKCNFRCVYCYETFAIGKMKPAVRSGLKNLIDNRVPDLAKLAISWFGGEPLTAPEIVEEISSHAKIACESHDAVFSGSMTTNGYLLTLDRLHRLTNLNVRSFQITLDGPPDIHDQTRLMRSGRGSFKVIWDNLLAARASDAKFNIMIRLHIRPSNFEVIRDWLPELDERLLSDPRFTLLIKAVEHLGGPNDELVDVYGSWAEKHAAIAQLMPLMKGGGAPKDDIISKACYACRPNAWVIRADGRLARCTVALEDDRNTIGTLSETGDLLIDNEKLAPWFKGLETLDPSVISCPIHHL